MNKDTIYQRVRRVINLIKNNEVTIVSILKQTETYKTAKSEIGKSIYCLENIEKQVNYLMKSDFSDLCVFLPLNQPLYSLILFVIIPGCMFSRVFCRPPVLLEKVYSELFSVLELNKMKINCMSISRRKFINQHVIFANAVIYSGKYENAIEVMQYITERTIFIYQGSGTNPIIIAPNVEITTELIIKVVNAQLYNSGQDCMAPSAIFIARNNWQFFLEFLIKRLDSLIIGNYDGESTDIAPMIEEESFNEARNIIDNNKSAIIYGGEIKSKQRIIKPTIIRFQDVYSLPCSSSFSPIFCLYCYDCFEDVSNYLNRKECQENKAYVSIFGNTDISFGNEIVITDDILDSVDKGYSEFGGFGKRSGFISYNGMLKSKPILISKELAMFSGIKGVVMPFGDLENPIFETNLVLSAIDMTGKNVIEVGCGIAPHARIIASYCDNYIAIDSNVRKVQEANDKIVIDNLSIKTMNGSNIKFEDKKFDIALMFHCLHEVCLEQQGAIVKEIYRTLKDKGILLIIDATSENESDFQKAFDIVHEQFCDYKHILSVKHSEWIISEYIKRGFFREIRNEKHNMIFSFSNIDALRVFLLNSFMFEYDWDDESQKKLTQLVSSKYKRELEQIDLVEIIKFRVLIKEDSQGDFDE